MLIAIPLRRRTYLWDTASGELTRLSELEAALLAEAPQPMPAACPTATRYAVAKYDSRAVDEAYDALRDRFAAADGAEAGEPRLILPEGTSSSLAEAALRAASAAFPKQPLALTADDAARQIAADLGVALADA